LIQKKTGSRLTRAGSWNNRSILLYQKHTIPLLPTCIDRNNFG